MDLKSYPQIKSMSPLLLVANLEHSLGYFTKEMGFDIIFRYEDFYAGIAKDGFSIHLKLGNVAAKRLEKDVNDVDITFSIDNIDVFYQEIKNRPVNITQPLREMPYGKEFYVADPDGNMLAFVEEKQI